MPTMRDVAKKAGVSPITVSRVVNHSGYVSKKTRARVEAVIEELNYVPNMLGPSLRFRQTMTLAVVVTDVTNPFFTTLTRGVEDVAQANGYSTILCNTDESETKQEQYLQMLLQRRTDGILLVPASSQAEPIRMIQSQGIPVVVLDRQVEGVEVDIVRADSEGGAYHLTQHLLSLGHRHIMILTGPHSVSTSVDRVKGFLRALEEAGREADDDQICWGNYSRESGYEMARMVAERRPRPTAIFAGNNFIASGAIQAFREKGLRVPQDIALVTFDDIPPNYTLEPFLSVAVQPAREMGRQGAKLLLERIKGEGELTCRQIVLPTEIIIRTSSGESIDA